VLTRATQDSRCHTSPITAQHGGGQQRGPRDDDTGDPGEDVAGEDVGTGEPRGLGGLNVRLFRPRRDGRPDGDGGWPLATWLTPPLSNDRVVADAAGAAAYLRELPGANGKVGAVGLGFGGYLAFLVGTSMPVDAVVNCYGTWIGNAPPAQAPMAGAPQIIDRTPQLQAPLLGLFGAEDQMPSPAQVAELEQALKASGKTYEFHSYEGAGHGFFAQDRPSYRAEAAADGHLRILTWLGSYLAG
jgi:dienelactone hydrolase